MTSATEKTLTKLRKDGWMAQNVEQFNNFSKTRKDLFGFIDILAVYGKFTLGIQATTMANKSNRLAKFKTKEVSKKMRKWKDASNRLELWCWRKLKRGARYYWEVDITEL